MKNVSVQATKPSASKSLSEVGIEVGAGHVEELERVRRARQRARIEVSPVRRGTDDNCDRA